MNSDSTLIPPASTDSGPDAVDSPPLGPASRPGRRVGLWLALALFGGMVAVTGGISWFAFGSIPVALRYLRGERLILEPARIHAANLTTTEPVAAYTEIRNYTPRPVQLLGASARCTCVFALDLPATIPAGRTFRLPVKVRALSDKPSVDETLIVFTDCKDRPQLRVRVSGTARR